MLRRHVRRGNKMSRTTFAALSAGSNIQLKGHYHTYRMAPDKSRDLEPARRSDPVSLDEGERISI